MNSASSALAASGCGKGMLWPYVRQPGDCLTDDEIKAGQRGVYQGALNTNPDMSAVKVVEPPTNTVESGSSGGLFSRIMGGGGGGSSTPVSVRPSAAVTVPEVPCLRAASATVFVVTADIQRMCPPAAVARTSESLWPFCVSLKVISPFVPRSKNPEGVR